MDNNSIVIYEYWAHVMTVLRPPCSFYNLFDTLLTIFSQVFSLQLQTQFNKTLCRKQH